LSILVNASSSSSSSPATVLSISIVASVSYSCRRHIIIIIVIIIIVIGRISFVSSSSSFAVVLVLALLLLTLLLLFLFYFQEAIMSDVIIDLTKGNSFSDAIVIDDSDDNEDDYDEMPTLMSRQQNNYDSDEDEYESDDDDEDNNNDEGDKKPKAISVPKTPPKDMNVATHPSMLCAHSGQDINECKCIICIERKSSFGAARSVSADIDKNSRPFLTTPSPSSDSASLASVAKSLARTFENIISGAPPQRQPWMRVHTSSGVKNIFNPYKLDKSSSSAIVTPTDNAKFVATPSKDEKSSDVATVTPTDDAKLDATSGPKTPAEAFDGVMDDAVMHLGFTRQSTEANNLATHAARRKQADEKQDVIDKQASILATFSQDTDIKRTRDSLSKLLGDYTFCFEGVDAVTNAKANGSNSITTIHRERKQKVEESFRNALLSDSRLAILAKWATNDDGTTIKKDIEGNPICIFYDICRGDKSDDKLEIVNKCLIKWFMMEGYKKKDGGLLQPNSFTTKAKTLFAIFARRGIQYVLTNDFKFEGGFDSYASTLWRETSKNNSKFGNRPTKRQLPDNLNDLVRKKLELELALPPSERSLDLEDPMFIYMIFLFVMATRFLFRGQRVSSTV
jgi:hypothetical protein